MITVVIPVYNTEKYIGRCMDSVLDSTYQNFELIVVDDGSTDNSLEVCRQYSRKDDRIKVFAQEKRGVSAARNRGIEESNGEWIVFVDSDDMISDDFLGLVAKREYQNMDILFFNHSRLNNRRKFRHKKRMMHEHPTYYHSEEGGMLLIGKMLCALDLTKDSSMELLASWAKAYRRSLIETYGVRFPEDIIIGEDKIFNVEYYAKVKAFACIPVTVYFLEWRADSATHCFQLQVVRKQWLFQEKLKLLLEDKGIFERLKGAYYENVFASMTEILIYGVFHPSSTRTYHENCELCHRIRENEIYKAALQERGVIGNVPRRILLFFYNLECWGMVNLLCKLSYLTLRLIKK